MSKTKTFSLLFMILLIVVASTFVASTKGQINEVSIRFRALAAGRCFIGYGEWAPEGIIEWTDIIEWAGNGSGDAIINGRAEAVFYMHLYPFGRMYLSESLDAHGVVSFSWIEEDGSKHKIMAVLFSDASTSGGFGPDVNCFSVPTTGPQQTPPLRFKGIHTAFDTHRANKTAIGGWALFATIPPGPPDDPDYQLFPIIQVYLVDETTQKVFIAIWVAEAGLWPILYYPPPVYMPAAQVFQHKVEIKS